MRRLTIIPTLFIWLGIVAVVSGLLYASGRPLICPCGIVKFVDFPGTVGQDSMHFLDIFSFTHVLHGLLFYFLIWLVGRGRIAFLPGLLIATVIEGGWELFENSRYIIERYQDQGISELYKGDSVLNAVGDIVTMSLGYVIAARVPVWASVALFILVEVWLAWLIRDNLTLNVISLTYPIEAISKWQEGGS